MQGSTFSLRLGRWLEKFHFSDDPFALYEADQERPYLHNFFVDRPYIHEILGDPARPQTAFLLAGRGAGKTATRNMVAYECTYAKLRRRALPVHYYDFSPLLEQVNGNINNLTVRHHIQVIARAIMRAIVEDVPSTYFDVLPDTERELLVGYAEAFADPISRIKLSRILNNKPLSLDWQSLSPFETLKYLSEIVVQLGETPHNTYQSLYILIDRVDETPAGPEATMALLKPLISEQTLLNMSHLAFKFFLPQKVGLELRQATKLPVKRLCVQTIQWNKTSLREVLEQRIAHYSGTAHTRLEELCTTGAKTVVTSRLINASDNSPRTLLRLCQSLIHYHVQHANDALITRQDITNTLAGFTHQQNLQETKRQTITLQSLPSHGLHLDDSHVWVNGKRLTSPLSRHEFRLLQKLYIDAPELIHNDALIEAVWQSMETEDDDIYSHDDTGLRKLISRLRKRLPGNGKAYIKNVRGRGYWLNINPESETPKSDISDQS